jgi:hypothetical protein
VIPALSAGIVFNSEWLENPHEYFVQYLSVCLPLLIQPLFRNLAVID